MKKTLILMAIGVVLLFLVGATQVSATIWYSNRSDIAVSSGTVDIDYSASYDGTTTDVSINYTLPCTVADLTAATTVFAIQADGNDIYYNLTVNGNSCNDSSFLTDGTGYETTVTDMIGAGVSGTDEYLDFTFNVSLADNLIWINITADDATLSATWLSGALTIRERDFTTPSIETKSTQSYFTVNDSCNVTSELWFPVSDLVLNITYPGSALTQPDTNFTIASLDDNASTDVYVAYQKNGPYVYAVDSAVDGRTHTVTVNIWGRELLTNVVDWSLSTTDEIYDGAFTALNYDTLTVKLNNVEIEDWTKGSINIDDLTVKTGSSSNEFVFEWVTAAGGASGTGGAGGFGVLGTNESVLDWFTQTTYFGVPLFIWIAIIAVIIVAIVLYAISMKPKKKSRKK